MGTRNVLRVRKAFFSSTLSWRHQNDHLESVFLEVETEMKILVYVIDEGIAIGRNL